MHTLTQGLVYNVYLDIKPTLFLVFHNDNGRILRVKILPILFRQLTPELRLAEIENPKRFWKLSKICFSGELVVIDEEYFQSRR